MRGCSRQRSKPLQTNLGESLKSASARLELLITAWALAGGALLLLVVVATTVNAAGFAANLIASLWGGYVPGLSGYEDAAALLVGVAALAMFPYCQMRGGHAVVDMFMARSPLWVNKGISVVSCVAMLGIALSMAWMLARGSMQLRADSVETPVLGWPVWIFAAAAIPSCILWGLASILQSSTCDHDADHGP